MKKTLLAVLVLAIAGAAIWFGARRNAPPADAGAGDALAAANDFEAYDVLMRQMGADGRLQYEIEARQILQAPGGGRVLASGLTLRHDPPGTEVGGAQRWELTAAEGELPAQGRVLTLSGDVRAQGLLAGGSTPLQVTTDRIQYDLDSQEFLAAGDVLINRGPDRVQGRGLKANIATGRLTLESIIHGTIHL